MRKFIFLVFLSAFIISSCNRKETNFKVSGVIDGAKGKMLYFERVGVATNTAVDSVELSAKGAFSFADYDTIPTFYQLKLESGALITLLVDSGQSVVVNGDYSRFASSYEVSGSKGSESIKPLSLLHLKARTDIYLINNDKKLSQAVKNDSVGSVKRALASVFTDYLNNYDNVFSMTSLYVLSQRWDDGERVISDPIQIKKIANTLSSIYPSSINVKSLYNEAMGLIKQERAARWQNTMDAMAVDYPEIELPDVNGRLRSLSALEGKMVLIQFWSTDDATSRIQNEALVAAYKKYRSKGFEIYQVSIDEDESAWKEAIKADGLSWINVGDMEGSVKACNSYNVKVIPTNFIINKKGELAARDLVGTKLDKYLSDNL
ncbi:MAG: thioredoxin-like domain-containing protein [Bacteroidales bacterium]